MRMRLQHVGYPFLLAMTMLSGTAYVSKAASPAGPPPDVTKDPKAAVGNDWNLGPTGMRGWMFVRDNYTDEARQIIVTKIDKGSPADGVMELGDVILGVGIKPFAEDARHAFGHAIGEAEQEDHQGLLNLLVWRKGAQKQIRVKLRVMGAYSDTAPYDCPKSKQILDDGCRYISEGLAKGQTENRCHIAHLALLASGNPAYRDELRTYAHKLGNPNAKFSIAHWVPGAPGGWTTGYTCVYLSEYYLATGDAYVLPLIKEYAHFIALGQSRIGSWASNMAWTDLNGGVVHGNLPGYGALNQAGLVCHMGLILAKKCGTEDPEVDQALDRANRFFGYYIGKGTIPYGDHNPTLNCHDDNGKNCEGALVFDLQGLKEGSQFFTKLATASYEDREEGHTGNTFSHQWAGPGVARGGPKAVAAFLKEMRWYYDSARCWNGSFIYQGLGGGAGGYWDSTAGYMLTYALPLRKIYLTGKDAKPDTWLSDTDVKEAIEAGRSVPYDKMEPAAVMKHLGSWSLVVRTRAAESLAQSKADVTPGLVQLLEGDDPRARIGACQVLRELKARGAAAVPALTRMLDHDEVWVRICAGEALAGIGEPARAALPAMLNACAREDPKDPRGFQPRGLAFSLFYPGGALGGKGLLADSIQGVDRALLYPAIRRVVRTDDGRARGCMRSTYQLLTLEDIRELAPDILFSIEQKAPSGEMFAGGVRLAGVKMLAKHRIKEGIPLCFTAMDWRNWGAGERIAVCLDTLKQYGANALPLLKEIERTWTVDEATKNSLKPQLDKLREVIRTAENDNNPPKLISIKDLGAQKGTSVMETSN
ncbi:MAG: DUF6288 domain-containing protein [Planctomycetota bacterium]